MCAGYSCRITSDSECSPFKEPFYYACRSCGSRIPTGRGEDGWSQHHNRWGLSWEDRKAGGHSTTGGLGSSEGADTPVLAQAGMTQQLGNSVAAWSACVWALSVTWFPHSVAVLRVFQQVGWKLHVRLSSPSLGSHTALLPCTLLFQELSSLPKFEGPGREIRFPLLMAGVTFWKSMRGDVMRIKAPGT